MIPKYLLLCLLAYFTAVCVAHEAIMGGNSTELKPFRYMVSLLEVNHGHICGGAIVGEQHVLTAAHCFINSDNSFKNKRVVALMGTNDLLNFGKPAMDLEVIKVYVPVEYNATKPDTTGDIAVLKLKDSLHIAKYRYLIQIKLERSQRDIHDGKKAIFSGWGWNTFTIHNNREAGYRTDPFLRYAMADVLSNHHCQEEYPALNITREHICARVEQHEYERRGVCNGDDGGPLVHDGTLIGVLSRFPNNCAEIIEAAIYTRVSRYLTFIRNAKMNKVTLNMRTHELV